MIPPGPKYMEEHRAKTSAYLFKCKVDRWLRENLGIEVDELEEW